MKLTLLILASLFCMPLPQKQAPPEPGEIKKLEKEVKRSDWYPKSQRQYSQQLAGAVFTGKQAAQSSDSDSAWVMYSLAMKQANAAGDLSLSHLFARKIADEWTMPASFLLEWHNDAVKRARNDAQVTELAKLFLEDFRQLSQDYPIKDWEKAYKKVQRLAAKSRSEFTKRACQTVFAETDAWFEVADGLRKENTSAAAFNDILAGRVAEGIRRLTQSKDSDIAAATKLISQSDVNFSGAHQRLLTALSKSKNDAAKLSARRIFESMVDRLDQKQIDTCQRICFGMTEDLPLRGDFALPFFGMPYGYLEVEKGKTAGLAFNSESSQWLCASNASIDWSHAPFDNYVQEFDLTITAMGAKIDLLHGGEDSAIIRFEKVDDAVRARLLHRVGNGFNWRGSRTFKEGEQIKIRVYRTPERMFAFLNGNQLASRHFGLCWNRVRLRVGKNSQMVVSRILTRPWLPGDREVLKKLAGDNKSIEMTATDVALPTLDQYSKYIQSCAGAEIKPAKGKSFLTPIGIVMRPVAAGIFERGEDSRKVMISNDFYCSAHEITQMQFGAILGYNPASLQGNPNLPVDNVSFTEATNFCEQLTKSMAKKGLIPAGYEYRLPTEAEWTLAAMDDGKNEMDVPTTQCWNWDSAKGGFQMVGTSTPNKRGIFDMHGNVEELTADRFTKRDAKSKDRSDIVDPVNVPTKTSPIVVKGGSWNVGANQSTAKQRDSRDRVATPSRGFRVVLAPRLN